MKTFTSASPTLVTPNIGVASGSSLQLGTVSVATGQLKLANAGSALLTTLQAGAAAAARTYTWPTDFGAAGTVLTDAAGDGTLSWGAGGGGVTNPLTLTRLLTITQGTANEGILASTGYSLTGANAQSMIDLSGTLNTSGSPDVIALRITDTARGVNTKLFNIYAGAAGATSVFSINRLGGVTLASTITGGSTLDLISSALTIRVNGSASCLNPVTDNAADLGYSGGSNGWKGVYTNGGLHIQAPATAADVHLMRRGIANLQLGIADAAAPVAQTLSVQSVVAGTSNTAGVDTNITGSLSTGSGIAGKIKFNVSQIVAAATTQNAASTVLSLNTVAASGVQFPQYGAGALSTDASGNITATSDERLKHVTGHFKAGLAELMKIDPIVFKWREDSGMETAHEYVGFGAHNVQESMPEAVGQTPDGYLTLSDRALLAACVNAIKDLSERMHK
jgi:hypothetical protein